MNDLDQKIYDTIEDLYYDMSYALIWDVYKEKAEQHLIRLRALVAQSTKEADHNALELAEHLFASLTTIER